MILQEIGGYIEFEYYHGKMLHETGIKLDCGRSCLAYLIEAKHIKKLAIPAFMCEVIFNTCDRYGVQINPYHVGYDLRPGHIHLDDDEYILIVNYYGQLTTDDILMYKKEYNRVIVDNTQAYFAEPVGGVDTIYSCRKYFGVPDGGILFTDSFVKRELQQSESYNQMLYLFGRFERNASEFYKLSSINNKRFEVQAPMRMSKITENLLHGIDYEYTREKREENFSILAKNFKDKNRLKLRKPVGPFAYPLLVSHDANTIRKKLAMEKIYIPTLWPNVIRDEALKSVDYDLAMNTLPIPCDQRYGREQMDYLVNKITTLL